MKIDEVALARIRRYLEDAMYGLVDFRLSFEAPIGPTGFPKFDVMQGVVGRLDPPHRTLFQLLRLAAPAAPEAVERVIPPDVLAAFVRTGLLVRGDAGEWRTPALVLVPVEGALVFVSVPPSYPTASGSSPVWFDLSSYVVAKSLPGSLAGARVLDICSGSGIQSLLCVARGAAAVTGLDLSEEAVELARLNAVLNGAGRRMEVRRSDKLAALDDGERFDFIVCNTPYAPVIEGAEAPAAPAAIGNSVLLGLLDRLPAHLTARGRGILAAWRSIGRGHSTWQTDLVASRLAGAGLSTVAFLDRAPDTVDSVLRILRTDVEQRYDAERAAGIVAGVQEQLREAGAAAEGFYNQLILFTRGDAGAAGESTVFRLAPP